MYYIAMKRNDLLEKIDHRTDTKPFSLHRTIVEEDNTNALYLHFHPEMEFLFLREGELTFFVEGKCYEMHRGDAIFIPPFLVHNATKREGSACDFSAVVFSSEWLWGNTEAADNEYTREISKNRYACVCHLTPSENPEALSFLESVFLQKEQSTGEYELSLKGRLFIVFQELYNSFLSKLSQSDSTPLADSEIQRSIEYINSHFMDRLSLSVLAEISGYSMSRFEHKFKEMTGSSPFEYINRIRVINASRELAKNNKKITDIASLNGFDNISYFNRTFKKIMGTSPKRYRASGSHSEHT